MFKAATSSRLTVLGRPCRNESSFPAPSIIFSGIAFSTAALI